MADVEAVAEVGAALSPDSLTALTDTIAKALDEGFADFSKRLIKALRIDLGKIQRDVEAGAKKIAGQYDAAAKSAGKMTTGLRGADRETLRLVQAMTELAQSQKVIQSAIVKSGIVTRQQMIAQRIESDRTQQKVIEDARNSAKVIATQAQVAGQQQIVATRYAGQQRVQITRAVIENIARLERGLAATIAGIARTAVGATGKVFGSLTSMFSRGGSSALNSSSFTSSIRRMNSELNRDVTTSLSRRESSMRSSFMRQERLLVESATRQAKTLEVMRRQTSSGVLGAATGRGVGPGLLGGVAAGAGVGALLTSGFTRFSDIERLTKQFTALTGSAEQAAAMLAQVKEFAKLTPFDLVGVADLAKGMIAIGTATEDVMPKVRVLADAVAFTGGTVDSMNRIQRAIGQVVSAGRLQGDELNQLAENLPGLNLRKILAEQITGGDVRKLVEMQEAGEISSEMFVDGLINGLAADTRIAGAAEDLAETLSGRVANLKESFADFGASLIGLVAKPLRAAVLGAQSALQGLADFVKGEGLSKTLETLRFAIGGLVAGLLTVVQVRGAIQVLSLLGRAATLVLTPFGLLATAAGLIGAAIAVMVSHNFRLREAFRSVAERVGEVGGKIRELFQPAIDRMMEFVNDVVIPGLSALGEFLANNLVDAFDAASTFITGTVIPAVSDFIAMVGHGLLVAFRATSDFITNTAIPALGSFVGFVRAELFPVAETVGTWVAGKFMTALRAVQNFGRMIRPYVQPAIDGFKALGAGVAAVFGGDWAALGRGALGALGGLGTTISNLFGLALEALKPLGRRLLDWLGGLFTEDNLMKAWGGVLEAIEWIAEQLGHIVTHPAFVTALAAIAVAAVQVAFRFVKGLIEGVAEGLPRLWDFIYDEVIEELPKALLPVAVIAALATAVALTFRKMGAEAGGGFMAGLRRSLSAFGAQGAGGFMRGLFGGPEAVSSAAMSRNVKAKIAEVQGLQNQLRVLGSPTTINMDTKSIRAAKREIDLLGRGITDAELRGLQFRDRMRSAFASVGAALTGGAGIVKGIGQFAASLARLTLGGPLKAIGLGMKATLMPASEFAATGVSWGRSLASGFTKGLSTIKTSWTTMMATLREQAASQNTTLGAQAKQLGVSVAQTFALGFATFMAGKFMAESGMSKVMTTLSGAAGGFAVGGLPGAVVGGIGGFLGGLFGESAREAKEAQARIEGFAGAIRTDLADALAETGPLLVEWNDLLAGGGDTDLRGRIVDALGDLVPLLNDLGISVVDIETAFKGGEEGVAALQERLRDAMGDIATNPVSGRQILDAHQRDIEAAGDAIIGVFEEIGIAIDEVNSRELFLGNLGTIRNYGGTSATGKNFGAFLPDKKVPVPPEVAKARMDAFYASLLNINTALDDIFGGTATDLAEALRLKEAEEAADGFYRNLRNVNSAWDSLSAIPKPPGPKQAEQDMRDLQAAAEDAAAAIARALTPPGASTFGGLVADAILSLRGAGQIGGEDGFTPLVDTVDPAQIAAAMFDRAEWTALQGQISSTIGPIISAAVAEGMDPVVAFDAIAGDLKAALLDGVTDPAVKAQIEKFLSDLRIGVIVELADKTPLVTQDDIDFNRARMNGPAGIKVPVKVDKVDVTQVSNEQRGNFQVIGGNMGLGIAAGLRGMIGTVRAAATEVADAAASAVTYTMKISSPSKVMISLGEQIGAGLAEGIRNSENGVIDSIDSIVSEIVGKVSDLPLSASLFSKLSGSKAPLGPGGQSQLGFTSQVGQFTSGFNGLLSTFASNVSRVFDIAAKKAEERTPADVDVMGESPFSLSVFDVLGAANVEAFVGLFDQIHEMGVTLFAEGKNVTEVFSTIQGFRDQVLSWAEGVGFSTDQLNSLIDSLGLSDAALVTFAAGLQNAQGGLAGSGTTPGGMTTERAKQIRSLEIEALTLSKEDLEVFVRENDVGEGFIQKLRTTQSDVADNSDEENRALGRALGLWGDALESFVDRLEEWAEDQGTRPDDDKGTPEIKELPRPIQVDIHPPYGDPVAIGIGAANAVARMARVG